MGDQLPRIEQFQPADDEPEVDDYKGGKGWVIVAVGEHGACLLEVGPGFGSMRWCVQELGLTVEELDLDLPDDPGIYRGEFDTWTTSVHDYDGADNDLGFTQIGDWVDLMPQGVEQAVDWTFAAYSNDTLEWLRDRAAQELADRKEIAEEVARGR